MLMLLLRLTKQFCVREESDPSRSPSLGLTQGLGWSERPSQLVIQYLWAEAVRWRRRCGVWAEVVRAGAARTQAARAEAARTEAARTEAAMAEAMRRRRRHGHSR